MESPFLLHASCVALGGRGVLLAGPSGIGKSDLALRLIDGGATLVADDQTALEVCQGTLWASAPQKLAGLIEVREVGLLRLPYLHRVAVSLFVELVNDPAVLERLPDKDTYSLLDHPVRRLKLPAWAASTPAKIRFALQGTIQDVG